MWPIGGYVVSLFDTLHEFKLNSVFKKLDALWNSLSNRQQKSYTFFLSIPTKITEWEQTNAHATTHSNSLNFQVIFETYMLESVHPPHPQLSVHQKAPKHLSKTYV